MLKLAVIGNEYYKSMQAIALKEDDASSENFFAKALTYDTANSGKDFIPTKWSAEIITQIYERAWHRQVLPTWKMSAIKEKLPRFTTRKTVSYIGASITSTDPANQLPLQNTANSTDDVEIELKTLTVNLMVDKKFLAYNASEQVESVLKEDIINSVMEAEINVIINGDDSTVHQDSDVTDANDVRKAFKGLRKLATATAIDAENAEVGKALVSKIIKSLGRYAQGRKNRCVLLGSTAVADQIRRNIVEIQTWDKYQGDATIFKGEIPPVYGVQFIESNYVREDLNASGVHDGVTEDRTELIAFNADELFIGVPVKAERTLSLEVWNDPRFQYKQLIMVEDLGFQARHSEAIAVAYNVATETSISS